MNELLEQVAAFTEKWVKDQIRNRPFQRPNKVGGIINPSPRRISGTGNLERSVEVIVEDDEILVLMDFYGADILFGEGRRSGAKQPPTEPIREWARIAIPGFNALSQSEQKGMSFAIARNIAKRGIGALNLFNLYDEEVFDEFQTEINRLIDEGNFEGLGLNVEDVLDKILLLSKDNFELSLT